MMKTNKRLMNNKHKISGTEISKINVLYKVNNACKEEQTIIKII